jgi:predicted flap endonuclease-1-like 5' DNA nuclease
LAALRRNSEAVDRGEQLSSTEHSPAKVGPGESENKEPPFGPGEKPSGTKDVLFGAGESSPQEKPSSDTQAPALSAMRQRWFNQPELTQRSKEYPDDLSKIKGIGDVYKQRLYRAGFYTWKQIAETDSETLRRATSAYPSSNVEEWHGQAEKLMEKFGRKEAVYNGPPPDDMTKILGIGPVGAAVLYRAGICTYEQLASTPTADLQALFPIAVAGDQPDFDQWLERATTLADDKYRDK